MAAIDAAPRQDEVAPGAAHRRPGALRRLRRRPAAAAGGLVILLLVVLAAGADLLAPYGPYEQFLQTDGTGGDGASGVRDPLAPRVSGKFLPPSADHPFGTDELARDILSRTLFGLRISLATALLAFVAVSCIGVTVGMLAVAGPRWVDRLLMQVTDITYAFPDLLLIVLLRAAFGAELFGLRRIAGLEVGIVLLFLAIALTAWPTMARLVRAQMLSLREQDFSTAAVALGASPARIAVRHWLPNASGPLIVEATFLVPRAIFAEAALSFIGIGIAPPVPSLGTLIASHFTFVGVQWTALAIPTVLLVVLFLAFQLLGDGLRDALDPTSGGHRTAGGG